MTRNRYAFTVIVLNSGVVFLSYMLMVCVLQISKIKLFISYYFQYWPFLLSCMHVKYVRLYHPLDCLYWGFASQSTLFRSCCHCWDAYLREGFFLEDKTQCWWDSNTVLYSSASSTTRPPCSQIVVYEQDETESLSTAFEARYKICCQSLTLMGSHG